MFHESYCRRRFLAVIATITASVSVSDESYIVCRAEQTAAPSSVSPIWAMAQTLRLFSIPRLVFSTAVGYAKLCAAGHALIAGTQTRISAGLFKRRSRIRSLEGAFARLGILEEGCTAQLMALVI
ncbi:hypothetical protein HGRIS_008495 [Hohenbuehelia grisea]|uniref:Secreted protein n=1 Tax=Hohenbuehelia grisea TaxID=104357 RepID=A0ABR3J8N9_9AGAR